MSVKRRNCVLFGLVITAVFGSSHVALAQEGTSQRSTYRFALVQKDLEDSMRNEALDAAKYEFYAQQARERGNQELAAVFERVANRERGEHFQTLAGLSAREVTIDQAAQKAELAKLPNTSDEANLRDAMRTERFEANTMRSDMVNRAIKYDDIQVAQTFLNVGQGEIRNLLDFRAAKKLLNRNQQQPSSLRS